jgi:Ca-activated chloride channel homolog
MQRAHLSRLCRPHISRSREAGWAFLLSHSDFTSGLAMRERSKSSSSIRKVASVVACGILAAGLTVALSTSWSKDISQNQPSQPSQFEIKSNVNVVLVHMTARDRDGNLAGQLDKDNFQIYEDGVLQQIESFSHEDVPVTVGLVVDNSGSMKPKRSEVIAATLAFVRSSNSQDEMFVVNFSDGVSFGLPRSTPFTDQPDQLKLALSSVEPIGKTALYDAVYSAVRHLKQGSHDKKALVVVSDGGDNASRHTLSETMALAVKSDAMIYSIGVFDLDDPDRNPHVLKEVAKSTGGDAFFPESTRDVRTICERIALEIRNQYTVTYISSNKKQDGTYRSIKVKVSAPDRGHLKVRARSGYYAPSNTESKRESKAHGNESSN